MKNLAAILRRGESSNQHTGRVHRLLAREEKNGRQEATATRREGRQRTTDNYTPAPSPSTFETLGSILMLVSVFIHLQFISNIAKFFIKFQNLVALRSAV